MRVLLVGAEGMLGLRLAQEFSDAELCACKRRDLDIRRIEDVQARVKEVAPHVILNAAGYTAVDRAEEEVDEAFAVNALGVRNLAAAAEGSLLVHFSTDYVFDGAHSKPYREWDRPRPLNAYGRSKWAGEEMLRDLAADYLLIRTSWLFGPGATNFVTRVLQQARSGDPLKVVGDQVGSPTYTADLAMMTRQLVERKRTGIYHITNQGVCSWFRFAQEIIELAGVEAGLEKVASEAFPAAAERPRFSVLDNMMLRLEGFDLLRSWQSAVSAFIRELSAGQPK